MIFLLLVLFAKLQKPPWHCVAVFPLCSAQDIRNLPPWVNPTEPGLSGENATARSRGRRFGAVRPEAKRGLELPEASVQTQQRLKVLWVSEPLP